MKVFCCLAAIAAVLVVSSSAEPILKDPAKGARIVYLGSGLGAQMSDYGLFETQLHLAFPDKQLSVRNLCFEGDTPGFRPRSGRADPWAFPGAENFRAPEISVHKGEGIEPSQDEWLTIYKADIIFGFFGYNESFDGPAGVDNFKAELSTWIDHSKKQNYNGKSAPQIVLISPIAFEDLSATRNLPDGKKENANLKLYVEAMREVADVNKVGFVDLYQPTLKAMQVDHVTVTLNGFMPNPLGNIIIASELFHQLYGKQIGKPSDAVQKLVLDKNWLNRQDARILNGVHVYGRRREPFGTVNYPPEIEKTREMMAIRDQAIWDAVQSKPFDVEAADAETLKLPDIETNFSREISFKEREEAVASLKLMEGFKAELFASESEFSDLRNPVQMSFDNQGRLWVATMPSYPAWKPGDPRPNDKLLIFEDTDGDGHADKQTVFADHLHLPIGFEIAHDGVYLSQQPNMVFLRDTDGDGKADSQEVLLRGFDSHDTHHAVGAFCADPMGAIFGAEGIFLHSSVETAYGPRRDNWSGVWRFDPHDQRLERYSQSVYANPWGIALDPWGQCFLADASTGQNWWELPISVKIKQGERLRGSDVFAPRRSRPTAGAEFVSSRHFPDELQGAFLVNNNIGFQGTSVHTMTEDGSGFAAKHVGDLLTSEDGNFRPVDLEFAPDGSLYVVDWHNPLVGHMQHSARDPNRDHDHGRIYRITYPSRPLVKPVKIAGATIPELLKALEEPEIRTRYRARRELRGHPADQVSHEVNRWLESLDPVDEFYLHDCVEALWVTAGCGNLDLDLLKACAGSQRSYRVRSAAVDIIRHRYREIPDHAELLLAAAADEHPQVRLTAMVAASWIGGETGARIAVTAFEKPYDKWMINAYAAAMSALREDITKLPKGELAALPKTKDYLDGKLKFGPIDKPPVSPKEAEVPKMSKADRQLYDIGKEVYEREAHCGTCHQENGMGDKIYPPLAKSPWVVGEEERLIKVALKGLWGPITVNGKTFDPKGGVPPMPGFGPMLKDEELAGVLTYVRKSFGNNASAIQPEAVAKVREATKERQSFYMVEDILKEHPLK